MGQWRRDNRPYMGETVAKIEVEIARLMSTDIPHIQARLSSLETQGKITLMLVIGLVLSVIGGGISVIIGG